MNFFSNLSMDSIHYLHWVYTIVKWISYSKITFLADQTMIRTTKQDRAGQTLCFLRLCKDNLLSLLSLMLVNGEKWSSFIVQVLNATHAVFLLKGPCTQHSQGFVQRHSSRGKHYSVYRRWNAGCCTGIYLSSLGSKFWLSCFLPLFRPKIVQFSSIPAQFSGD